MKNIIILIALLLFLSFCLKAQKSSFDMSKPSGFTFSLVFGNFSSTGSTSTTTSTSTATNTNTNTSTGINTGTSTTTALSASTISYSLKSYVFYTGSAIPSLTATITNGPLTNFTISPSLSSGLSMDSSGNISGTPSSTNSSTQYTISAKNSQGTSYSTQITIRVGSTTASNQFGVTGTTGCSASYLFPVAVAVDSLGNIYVSEQSRNRITFFPSGSSVPSSTQIYGQPNLTTCNTGTSSTGLNGNIGINLDSSNNLYVADFANNRVLYFPFGSTTATRVYGQAGSFTSSTANNGGITASSINNPQGVALDSSGNLYVADYGNNRILYFQAGSTTATRVYGQLGSFTSNTANNGGISANSMLGPIGLALDTSGNLYVADYGNYRVLYFPFGSTTATKVYGQAGSFTSGTANNGGISTDSLNTIYQIAIDPFGGLYIADAGNNRILYFSSGSTIAIRVFGQANFTSSSTGSSASQLNGARGVTVDLAGGLYIADVLNDRVLYY